MCLTSTETRQPLLKLLKITPWNEKWATVCPDGFSLLPVSVLWEATHPTEPRFQETRRESLGRWHWHPEPPMGCTQGPSAEK